MLLDHRAFGRIRIVCTVRDNVIPPELWKATKVGEEYHWKEGQVVAPTAYSEREMHFILRSYAPYTKPPYVIVKG